MEEVAELERSGLLNAVEGTRRAVVFYVDKGTGFLAYLTWWLYTWKTIGLVSPGIWAGRGFEFKPGRILKIARFLAENMNY